MRRFALDLYAKETIDHYVRQIPFFDRLATSDPAQYAIFLAHTVILELEPGEVLMEKGTVGEHFYSLVYGKLAIFKERRPGDNAICEVLPGQLLGALSIINHEPRTATVVVSSIEGATVFCTDYSMFGELDDVSVVSIASKRMMFMDVIAGIRQVIERCMRELPNVALSEELSTLEEYVGEEGSIDELEYLSEQAMALAWLLNRWNRLQEPQVMMFDEAAIEKRLMQLLQSQ